MQRVPELCRAIKPPRLVLLLASVLLLATAHPYRAEANIINVNTGADGIDFIHCTIRRAIENHNANGQPNWQCDPGSLSGDTIFVPQVMDLGDPLPAVSGNLTIERNSVACGNLRQAAYMSVNPGANLTLYGVGIQANGSHNISLIDNNGGTLTIKSFASEDNCRFSNEKTPNLPESGGILFNRNNGTTIIDGTNFVNSHARGRGGAIFIDSGSITITDSQSSIPSRFTDDSAFQGGAIFVNNNGTLNIASNNFTFINNQVGGYGAAIDSFGKVNIQRGTTTLANVSLAFNSAELGGGAIYSHAGQLSISGAQIYNNNSPRGSGGAVVVSNVKPPTPAVITQTYFHDNTASSNGGAIYLADGSTLNLSASTFYNDRGGVYVNNLSNLNVLNSTFQGNGNRDGIVVASGLSNVIFSTMLASNLGVGATPSIHLSNSILREVTCAASVLDDGLNLQFQSTGCPSSIQTMNPDLDPRFLQNNGGPTPTVALLAGSPAIDAISIPDCVDQNSNPVTTDQRGFRRPAGPKCDMGAYEFGATP